MKALFRILFLTFILQNSLFAAQNQEKTKEEKFFNGDFEKSIAAFQENFDEIIKKTQNDIEKLQNSYEKDSSVEMATYDRENFYLYQLKFKNFDKNEIAVKRSYDSVNLVENLSFSSKKSTVKNSANFEEKMQSSFFYEFTLPKDASKNMKIDRFDNHIDVKIEKKK